MTDAETRLRDYLQTAAAIVPDTAQGPGLDTSAPPRRRRWPIVLAAASIGSVLVLASSFLAHLTSADPQPASEPAPPVSAAAPLIPYTTSTGGVAMLHDGSRQVRVSLRSDGYFRGRVGGGWLGLAMPDNRASQVGLLMPNGSFRPLGPGRTESPHASPDRTLVVMLARQADRSGRAVVVDVRSGREVASTPVQANVAVLIGWNQDGIWMLNDEGKQPILQVWQPKSGQPRRIIPPGFDGALAMPATASNVVWSTHEGVKRCLVAGVLRGTTVEVLRKYCEQGVPQLYPVLSPDGRTMIQSVTKVAIDLATGKETKMQLPDQMLDFPEAVFEDATHLIAINQRSPQKGLIPEDVYRCDVTSGACKLLVKDADIDLQQP
jgi:hypothetical protein